MNGWTTLQLRATTPIFNNGATSDSSDMERSVRVPSIRGAMRFWFRALAATVTGPDPVLLSAVERQVFGDAKTTTRSACILRIPEPARAALRSQPVPDFLDGEFPTWVSYLLGQGLAEWDSAARAPKLSRPFLPPGTTFPLKIRFSHIRQSTQDQRHAIEALTYAALWLTSAYGGIGARTHRGFGGFEITGVDGDIPAPWTAPDAFRSPAIDHYEQLKNLAPTAEIATAAELVPTLLSPEQRDIAAQAPGSGSWPEFPVLDRNYTIAGLSRDKCATLTQLLERTGYKLRGFRTSESHVRGPYLPERDKSTPAWNHMRNDDLHEFPMSALGLPVNFTPKKSTDGPSFAINIAGGDHTTGPHTPLRQPSKLWLRPIPARTGNNTEWRLFSFAFLHTSTADANEHLCLSENGTPATRLTENPTEEKELIQSWISSPLPSPNKPKPNANHPRRN